MKRNKQLLIFSWIVATVIHFVAVFLVGNWALQSIYTNYNGVCRPVAIIFLVFVLFKYVMLSFLDDMRFFIEKKDEADM